MSLFSSQYAQASGATCHICWRLHTAPMLVSHAPKSHPRVANLRHLHARALAEPAETKPVPKMLIIRSMDQSISSREPFLRSPFVVVRVRVQSVRFWHTHSIGSQSAGAKVPCTRVHCLSKSTPRRRSRASDRANGVMMQLLLHHIYCQCLSKGPFLLHSAFVCQRASTAAYLCCSTLHSRCR